MDNYTYFITSTGTDCGKTYVTGGLARAWRQMGYRVQAIKPVLTGMGNIAAGCDDASLLQQATGSAAPPSPWQFAAANSPDYAAYLEEKQIDRATLLHWTQQQLALPDHDISLLEGIGGVMVPLNAKYTVRDWIAELHVPCILVAGDYLGAISHTLSALAALREVGIVPSAVVLNAHNNGIGFTATRYSLAAHCQDVPIFELERNDQQGLERLATALLLTA